jgi:hypothetical protein
MHLYPPPPGLLSMFCDLNFQLTPCFSEKTQGYIFPLSPNIFWKNIFGGTGICTQGLTPIRQPLQEPFFVWGIFEAGSCELFARAGLELQPPDLCLLSS